MADATQLRTENRVDWVLDWPVVMSLNPHWDGAAKSAPLFLQAVGGPRRPPPISLHSLCIVFFFFWTVSDSLSRFF